MNEIFKKHNKTRIELDEEWYLTTDSFKGLILQREKLKTRNKKDGTEEVVVDTESFYHPTLSQVLDKYLRQKTKEAKTVEELKEIVLRVEETIKNL